MPAPLIVAMGVSGSGKSTVGAALAQRLRVPFADADDFHPAANVAKMSAGTPLDGLDGLRRYLLTTRRREFTDQFCRKLLGYALGRAVQLSDRPLLAEMRGALETHDGRITAALETIVRSRPFLQIRGKEFASEE